MASLRRYIDTSPSECRHSRFAWKMKKGKESKEQGKRKKKKIAEGIEEKKKKRESTRGGRGEAAVRKGRWRWWWWWWWVYRERKGQCDIVSCVFFLFFFVSAHVALRVDEVLDRDRMPDGMVADHAL